MNLDPQKTLVREMMTKDVEMVHYDHTIQQAAKIMKNDGVGSVVIMRNKEPVGIMTERDFAIKVAAKGILPSEKISKVMTFPVIHISPKETILNASDIMIKEKIRKIPVYDCGKISGIITATDILRFFRFSSHDQIKNSCPLHTNERLVKTELTDGTFKMYCPKCEEFFEID